MIPILVTLITLGNAFPGIRIETGEMADGSLGAVSFTELDGISDIAAVPTATRARPCAPRFFSTISWAMRCRARRISSAFRSSALKRTKHLQKEAEAEAPAWLFPMAVLISFHLSSFPASRDRFKGRPYLTSCPQVVQEANPPRVHPRRKV